MALIKTATDILSGWTRLLTNNFDKELVSKRLAICKECPLNSNGFCSTFKTYESISGCGCAIKAKATLKTSKCPRNLWQT